MAHLDALEPNEENIAHIVGRTVISTSVEKAARSNEAVGGIWLQLDDGSRIIIHGLRMGGLEINCQSPDEAFEFDREVMEEGGFDGHEP